MRSAAARVGPYSAPASLARIDGRSREARFRKALRAQLVQHVGGKASVTLAALIEQAVDTALQIELMKQARASNGALTPHDHRTFLAWCNTYRRMLAQIGMRGEPPPTPSLADIDWGRPATPQAAA